MTTATPPPTADLVALVREIAASDPIVPDYGSNKREWECRYCERARVSKHFEFLPEYRIHAPDCLWLRARAIVARLNGKESE